MTELKQRKGVLILDQITFNYVFKRTVGKNNKTSGKISLPRSLIGRDVYVVVPKKGE